MVRIRLLPGSKVNIWALFQWKRDRIRMYKDPTSVYFNVTEMNNLIERYNTHKQWTDDASKTAKNSMRKSFTKKIEWMDWKSTLVNFLNLQPGIF